MNDPLRVRAGERGVIRLFALDMAPEQAHFLGEPGAVAQMLGVADLDPDHIDIIALADLEQLGLAGYLAEGCAVPVGQIDQARLTTLTGHVLLIRSPAFRDVATILKPAPQLNLISTYAETPTDWSPKPIRTDSSKPRMPPQIARDATHRVGAIVFAVMMLLVGTVTIVVLT